MRRARARSRQAGRQADRQAGTYVGRILHVGEVESDAFLVAIGIIVVDVQQALRIARAAPARATDRHRQNAHRHTCRQKTHLLVDILYGYAGLCLVLSDFLAAWLPMEPAGWGGMGLCLSVCLSVCLSICLSVCVSPSGVEGQPCKLLCVGRDDQLRLLDLDNVRVG